MIRGGLFTRYFLDDGIRETHAYKAIDPARLAAFAAHARVLWGELAQMRRPSEAETEAVFIFPVLDLLGWRHLPQQEPGRGRRDIADALLFLDDAALAKARATHQTADRFRLGAVVVENEARDTPLDRASGEAETPSVLHLTYVADDMAGFARDQGYAGPPFAWDEQDRLRRRGVLSSVRTRSRGGRVRARQLPDRAPGRGAAVPRPVPLTRPHARVHGGTCRREPGCGGRGVRALRPLTPTLFPRERGKVP
ncbi:MAG: hypothetical protein ABI224_15810 [Acetobacteraceae bacterium]